MLEGEYLAAVVGSREDRRQLALARGEERFRIWVELDVAAYAEGRVHDALNAARCALRAARRRVGQNGDRSKVHGLRLIEQRHDPARCRRQQGIDQFQDRSLTGPAAAYENERLPGRHQKTDLIHQPVSIRQREAHVLQLYSHIGHNLIDDLRLTIDE